MFTLYRTTTADVSSYSPRYAGANCISNIIQYDVTVECPVPSPNSLGSCDEACTSDSNCTGGQLCCSNGCGHQCMSPVEDPCAVSVMM